MTTTALHSQKHHDDPHITHIFFYLLGVLYSGVTLFLATTGAFNAGYFWIIMVLAGTGIALLPYKRKRVTLFHELSFIILFQLVIYFVERASFPLTFLILDVSILVALSYRMHRKTFLLLDWIVTVAWLLAFHHFVFRFRLDVMEIAVLIITAVILLVRTMHHFSFSKVSPRNIDVILCSYSGNTAHYADLFMQGAKEHGARTTIHRFHYYRDFTAELNGDALVIAFPIFGVKIPSHMLDYLLFHLPKGNGKPAFVLYTSFGGTENTAILAWLILTLKGYRVCGRNSGIYPMNVNFIRQGPKKLWGWIDSILPTKECCDDQIVTGSDFTAGRITGLPFIFLPSVIFILVFLVENKLVNSISKNWILKKRCNGCGLCIRYCPSERLKMVDGYPKSKGTCALCFGCVNICPRNAMRLSFFTIPFDTVYSPKYKEFIVQNRPN
jgi:ferredoxin